MTIDLQVLALMLAYVSGLLLLVMALAHHAVRRYPGPGWWLLANLSLAAGYAVNMIRDVPALHVFAIIANNLLFLLALFLLRIGLCVFFGLAPHLSAHGMWLLIATCVAAFFTVAVPDEAIRIVHFSLHTAAISFLTARTIWQKRQAAIMGSRYLLGVLYAVHGAFWIVRSLPVLFGRSASQYRASPFATALYAFQLAFGLLLTFGMVLLLNERLGEDNRQERETFEKAFEASPDAVLVTRLKDGVCLRGNSRFTRLLGYSQEDFHGRTTLELGLWVDPDDRNRVLASLRSMGYSEEQDYMLLRKDGSRLAVLFNASLITLDNELCVIGFLRDNTARHQAEERIRQLVARLETEKGDAVRDALTDALTGLGNRRHFDERMQAEFMRLHNGTQPLSLIIADVDFFKAYNDRNGHLIGDRALQLIACAMQGVVRRASDLVVRYGGEEFAVIMPDTDAEGAIRVAEAIRKAVGDMRIPHATSQIAAHITISLGVVTVHPGERRHLAAVVARADHALYRAKQGGRNRVAFDRVEGSRGEEDQGEDGTAAGVSVDPPEMTS